MSKALSGYGGNVKNDAVDCDVQGWAATFAANTWDSTTTADEGWDHTSTSTRNVKGTFDFLWNPDKQPHVPTDEAEDPGLGLYEGAVVPKLKLYVDAGTAALFYQGGAVITQVAIKSVTKAGITITASFENRGKWYRPGDTIPA